MLRLKSSRQAFQEVETRGKVLFHGLGRSQWAAATMNFRLLSSLLFDFVEDTPLTGLIPTLHTTVPSIIQGIDFRIATTSTHLSMLLWQPPKIPLENKVG